MACVLQLIFIIVASTPTAACTLFSLLATMVVFLQRIVLGLFLHYALLLAQCPPLGSVLPAPTGLSQSPVLQELVTQINVQLQNTSSTLNQTAVSIGVRSLHDSGPLMNFHHTPSKFNTTGVHKVDGNTVYRIGSTSKLFTALSILQLEGNGKVNLSDSVTKYVPGLGVLSGPNNSLTKVDWNSVTIEALLSHMGGVPADRTLGNPSPLFWVQSTGRKADLYLITT
jgi:hypothetical protein